MHLYSAFSSKRSLAPDNATSEGNGRPPKQMRPEISLKSKKEVILFLKHILHWLQLKVNLRKGTTGIYSPGFPWALSISEAKCYDNTIALLEWMVQ